MRYLPSLLLTSLAAISLLLNSGCGDNPADSGPPKIETGTSVDVVTESVPSSGGTVTIDTPGDSLDGLTIEVPGGSYADARSFRVSYAPVTSHELGADFNPLTPLITISNGGGYSEEPMVLTIPVTVPEGHFAMAFLFDEATGRLEGMPLLESASDHVTVVTGNFSHSAVMAMGKRGSAAVDDPNGSSKIIISSADTRQLVGEYDSGFRPGVDDWQYPNYGSWAASLGHCAGQSLGMMWYYTEKKRTGSPALNGLFDNDGVRKTPTVWQDDVHAYKYSSMLQSDGSWAGLFNAAQLLFQSLADDKSTMFAFTYALKLTKEPQLVAIYSNGLAGHAMVVYKMQGDKLYIADPNYPNDRVGGIGAPSPRSIRYDPVGEDLEAYNSGPNAANLGVSFSHIFYFGKSSLVNFNTPASRWVELENKSIGAGEYPDFTLVALDENVEFVPFVDGFKVPGRQLTINVRGSFATEFSVFSESGKELPFDGSAVELRPGKQLVGVYVRGKKHLPVIGDVTTWVGFKWISVEVPGDASGGRDCISGLTLDGKRPTLDSSRVTVFPMGVDIDAYFSDETLDMFGSIHISSPSIKGVGIFKDGGAKWYDTGRFPRIRDAHFEGDPNRDFTVTVTHYDAQSIEGTFRVKYETSSLPQPYVEGRFSCSR